MTLSVVLLFRNAAKLLPFWIKKAVPYADELVFVHHQVSAADTDDVLVRELVQPTGIPIQFLQLPPDYIVQHGFAAAYNTGIAAATGDWTLVLASDEWLEDGTALKTELAKIEATGKSVVGVNLHNCDVVRGRDCGKIQEWLSEIIWHESSIPYITRCSKRTAGWFYRGFIHEERYQADGTHFVGERELAQRGVIKHFGEQRRENDGLGVGAGQRVPLYSELLLRAYENPALREGTNACWYTRHIVNEMDLHKELSRQYNEQFPYTWLGVDKVVQWSNGKAWADRLNLPWEHAKHPSYVVRAS